LATENTAKEPLWLSSLAGTITMYEIYYSAYWGVGRWRRRHDLLFKVEGGLLVLSPPPENVSADALATVH